MNAISLSGRRRLPLVRQAEAAECGLACLAMVAAYHGCDLDMASMRLRFSVSMKGLTVKSLVAIGAKLGLTSRPVRCEVDELSQLRLPAILHWDHDHFVVLERVSGRAYRVSDPSIGQIKVSAREIREKFTGIAIELAPNAGFRRERQRSSLRLASVLSIGPSVKVAIGQALVLSIIVEALLLASPFYFQFVLDEAIVKGDMAILNVLAIAFSIILLFRVASVLVRSLTTQYISNVMSFDMKGRVFGHLIRLPLDWFNKRHIGDVQSRFWAIKPIQDFLSHGAFTVLVDGVLGAAVLIVMTFYSKGLTFLVLASLALICAAKIISFSAAKQFAADVIVTEAKEQTRLLESIRAIQTIRSYGAEAGREIHYRNAAIASANSQVRSGNINVAYQGFEQLAIGASDIFVIFFGAKQVIAGDLTVGMLTAFVVYKSQLTARFSNFLSQAFAWKLLNLQVERLADIVGTPKDEWIDASLHDGIVEGDLECKNVSFRYGFNEPVVIQNLSLKISKGECVAITGPSGCGKSTLGKLLIGLLQPSAGQIVVDDRSLRNWSSSCLRQQVAYVSQDDQLLAGSIAENISLFDSEPNMLQVQACAKAARIDGEISAMPMGYHSLVGDMGSALSGGQKQRIILARALYRKPSILLMDEATAHLDTENEIEIVKALSQLTMTRIVIAHRPNTIEAADRVISLDPRNSSQGILSQLISNMKKAT